MPRKKGQVYPSDAVYNERRRAKRLKARLESESSASKREAASRQSLIERLGDAISKTYAKFNKPSVISKTVSAVSKLTRDFQKADSKLKRRNILFAKEINRASSGNLPSSIHRDTATAQAYAKIFWRSTQRLWEGKSDKYGAILEGLGVESLEEAFNKVLNENRKAIRAYRREAAPIDDTSEAAFFYGEGVEDEYASPNYLAFVNIIG